MTFHFPHKDPEFIWATLEEVYNEKSQVVMRHTRGQAKHPDWIEEPEIDLGNVWEKRSDRESTTLTVRGVHKQAMRKIRKYHSLGGNVLYYRHSGDGTSILVHGFGDEWEEAMGRMSSTVAAKEEPGFSTGDDVGQLGDVKQKPRPSAGYDAHQFGQQDPVLGNAMGANWTGQVPDPCLASLEKGSSLRSAFGHLGKSEWDAGLGGRSRGW